MQGRVLIAALLLAACCLILLHTAEGCTNFVISKGATADGSTMISYAADSHVLYGALYFWPNGSHAPGTKRDVYDWDSGVYLGQIDEAPYTYNVVGNMNEFGLTITETTYGGLSALATQAGAILDYGTLIYVTLQRSRNAREAIANMAKLTDQYGYASDGETFSIGDPDEVWIMDFIGKGNGEKGAVWVARRVPDGYVTAHANQARIRTFPQNDPDNCLYAPDVVTFAQRKGLYNGTAADFSFADVYDPLTFEGARFCEARVWSFFRKVTTGMDDYVDHVMGYNLSHRLPLFVKPTNPIHVNQTIAYMRDHYENTPLDFRGDVGAQGFSLPYRWRPLTWSDGGNTYLNERSVGTQQTGFTLVGQMRGWMPGCKGLLWFGVDDTSTSVYAPMYSCMTRVPASYAQGNGDIMKFSFDAAFWVFNMVANFAYTRYSLIYPEVAAKIQQLQAQYLVEVADTDAQLEKLFPTNPAAAVEAATAYSVKTGDTLVKDWLAYWQYLFLRFMDGNVKTPSTDPTHPMPSVDQPGYPQDWLHRIVQETGDHYLEPSSTQSLATSRRQPVQSKLRFV